MTDQDESRPLSRREIRLREMAAAGVAPEETPAPQAAAAAGDTATDASDDIEISLFDETGRQRSRRELRALREQALAERAAAQQEAASAVEAEPEPEPEMVEPDPAQAEAVEPERDPDPVEVEPEPVEPEPEPAAEGPHAEEAQPERVLPETVAFDVIADQQPEPANDFAALLHEIAAENASALSEAEVFAEPDRGPQPEIAAEPQVQAEPEVEPEAQTEPDAPAEPEIQAEPEIEAETVVEAEAEAAPAAAAEDFEAHDYAAPSQGYSFPDIAPLDEGQSIFDDPALQVMNAQGAQTGPDTGDGRGFDDLITRAVAQEGAASSTSTSALILPSMPETDGLSGPLGETGELFVTGSFELPKSLSETGGHAALHDSVEADPLDELGFAEATPTGMMAPVSASRAVSARSVQGAFVAEATKDKSKMPVVLIATGGVLVLGAAGLIVWAAASGLFG